MYSIRGILSNFELKRNLFTCSVVHNIKPSVDGEFRVLDLKKKKQERRKRSVNIKPTVLPPRSESMPIDQDWVSIWPGPRSFHPASVPLPIRQGYPLKEVGAPSGKYANAELMKIPNFLHLTPPAIQRHCEAIKKFCSKFPEELNTDELCDEHFPVNITYNNFCYSSPSIRHPESRIFTLQIKLSKLELDARSKDKFLRLVLNRYDPETDIVTIVTDRCPTLTQNRDYAFFILAALYHESWKLEAWEKEKELIDMEKFVWDTSISKVSVNHLTKHNPDIQNDIVSKYAQIVANIVDTGENNEIIEEYKETTKKLLSLNL